MCYNVLCDKYATRQLYGYCPSWALNWEYRKKSIMQEIMGCNADIISLQVRNGKSIKSCVCLFFIKGKSLKLLIPILTKMFGSMTTCLILSLIHMHMFNGVLNLHDCPHFQLSILTHLFLVLTGSRDRAVLQLFLAWAEGTGIWWVLQSKVTS